MSLLTSKTVICLYFLLSLSHNLLHIVEPTTDRFIAVMYDDKEGIIPGNALVVDPKKQFRPLSKYGNAVSDDSRLKLIHTCHFDDSIHLSLNQFSSLRLKNIFAVSQPFSMFIGAIAGAECNFHC